MKKSRVIIATLVVLLAMAALTACGGSGGGEEAESSSKSEAAGKSARGAESYNTVEFGGMEFQVPDYFKESDSDDDSKRTFYVEKGDGLSYISFASMDGKSSEKDFSGNYDQLVDKLLEGMFSNSEADDSEKVSSEEIKTAEGVQAGRISFTFHKVSDTADMNYDGVVTLVNNSEQSKVLCLILLQSEESEYDYIDAFDEMIDGAKVLAVEEPEEEEPEKEEPEADDTADEDSGNMDPEFKETMDNYEAWFDHYCEVMKKYKENPSDMEVLTEMTSLLSEENEMLEQMESMDQSEMSNAELAYYLEVTARIEQKLLEVAY